MSRGERAERATFSLTRALIRKVDHIARRSHRSRSAVVREALEEYLTNAEPTELPSWIGMGDSGRVDGSQRVDEIIGEYLDERFKRKMGRD